MADLAKAYVQIVPSARGMKAGLTSIVNGEMPSGGKSAGSLFGSNLVSTIKGVITTAAIGTALSSTIMAGADLQQSLGGIETLFKDSAATVIANAEQAYKTAGMSANGYMEQVTSFSASLLQSLGGDTAKAADVADMALTDMSDNANKFGTDMERITDAYQGFAKQNYTMLDNLKLGYGGTKTEMQRLLKDAQALTGVKYDINNLSDVYNAIHVIQDELGVTGTTALEASQTLTGSFNAMKASFTNVLGNLALGRDITPSLNALVKTTTTLIKGNLIPAVLNILRALPGAAVTLLQALIPGGMQNLTTNIVTNFTTFMTAQFPMLMENGTQMINQMITGFLSGLPSFVATAGSLITQVLTTIAAALPTMLQSGTDILLNLVMCIMTALPSLITTAGQIVQNLLTALMAALPSLLSTGMSFIMNLASGLLASLPNIISSATTVVTNLLTTLASHLPDLLAQGISMIGQLVAGLISMIPDVISAAVDIGRGILNTIGEVDWISLGKNVIDGIINGIKNAAGSLFDALKDLASKALQAAKDALGIASPSRKFRDMVGKFIPAGVAKGVLQNLGLVKSAVRKMSDLAEDDFNASLRMDTRTGRGHSGGGTKGRSGVSVVQYIYSEAKTAADLMREARYQAEMAVLLGV